MIFPTSCYLSFFPLPLPPLHPVKSCPISPSFHLRNTCDLLLASLELLLQAPSPHCHFLLSQLLWSLQKVWYIQIYKSTKKRTRLLPFWLWVTSLSLVFPSSIRLPANLMITLFFTSEKNSIVYLYHIFLIHSSATRDLGSFYFLHSVNRAAINKVKHISEVGCWVLQIYAKAWYNPVIWQMCF